MQRRHVESTANNKCWMLYSCITSKSHFHWVRSVNIVWFVCCRLIYAPKTPNPYRAHFSANNNKKKRPATTNKNERIEYSSYTWYNRPNQRSTTLFSSSNKNFSVCRCRSFCCCCCNGHFFLPICIVRSGSCTLIDFQFSNHRICAFSLALKPTNIHTCATAMPVGNVNPLNVTTGIVKQLLVLLLLLR